jgi:hypothetical protein
MFKFAIPAVAALGLIAVAAQSRATDADVQGPMAPMSWHLSHEGSMAKLAYGVANSDQLAMMMTCEPGQAQAAVYGEVQPAGLRLTRASMAAVPIDPLSGGLADETRISLRDPVLQAFARRGRLRVEGEAGHFELTANGDERRLVGEFFAYCGTEAV